MSCRHFPFPAHLCSECSASLPVLLPSQILSPHLSLSSVPRVCPVMRLPCSRACSQALVCPFCLLSVQPDYQKDRWKELLTGTYIHQCPLRCQFGPHVSTSTVLLSWEGRLSAVPQSSEHTPSPGVELAHLNPGLNISVTVWHSWSGRSLPIVLRELLES